MRYWPTQIFPLLVLIVFAGLTFWLRQSVNGKTSDPVRAVTHEPDAKGENIVARRYDEHGNLQYRLTAPYLEHYPDDDSTALRAPVLLSYRQDAPPVSIRSDQAKVTSKGEIIYLWDNVTVTRPDPHGRPDLIARMPDLTARPDDGTASTDSPVDVTQGSSWLKGTGMRLDHNAATLELLSRVSSEYIRPPEKKP